MKTVRLTTAAISLCFALAASADERASQAVGQEQVEETLRRHVLKAGPWQPEQIEVRALSYKPVQLRPGKLALRVIKTGKGIGSGVQNFLVAADVSGKEESQIWVRTEIKVHDNVVVSARPLTARQVIGPDDVRLEWREINSAGSRPFTKIDEVVGKQASRAANVNEVLTVAMAELPQVVRHGSAVVLLYESSVLRVETAGEAVQAGRVGDLIRVKNPQSGKMLQGVVVDGRTVKVSQ